MHPHKAFLRLLQAFGPQGWWPVTPQGALHPVYRARRGPAPRDGRARRRSAFASARRRPSEREALEIAVGAILTQNTAWTNVEKALAGLNSAGMLEVRRLDEARPAALAARIRSSGYFIQKSRKLKVFVRHLAGRHGGRLLRWLRRPRLGALREELLGLYGIGPETADSILLYAGHRPAFVVDAYTLRIAGRIGWFRKAAYEQAKSFFERRLPRRVRLYQEFHALMVALAKRYCLKEPLCRACPLVGGCRYGARRAAGMAVLLLALGWTASLPTGAIAGFSAAAGKADITPDLRAERTFLAGFGAKGRKPTGVHDRLYARAVVVSDGQRTAAVVSVDLLGLYRNEVREIRRRLGYDSERRFLFITATHTHSGPDTLGLWGPAPGVSGINPAYQRRVRDAIVGLVERLSREREPVELVLARRNQDPQGLCTDSRDPRVLNPNLVAAQLRGRSKVLATLVYWSCHPEVLGAANTLVTADYVGPMCEEVEARTGGTCVFLQGTIGGLLTPDSSGETFEEADRIGRALAAAALETLGSRPERVGGPSVRFKREDVLVPIENSRYLLFLPALSVGHEVYRSSSVTGTPLSGFELQLLRLKHLVFRLKPPELPWVRTEVSRVDLGPLRLVGLPGEVFPELVLGGYRGEYRFGRPLIRPDNPAPPDLKSAPAGPYLVDRMGGRYAVAVGLANDMLGYVVPEYDFVVQGTLTLTPRPPGHHYEETNSVGRAATPRILEAAERLTVP